jgi:hypothetical protein
LRARALREEISRTEAGFLADEARLDRLQLNYDSACTKFAEAAQLEPDNVWLAEIGLVAFARETSLGVARIDPAAHVKDASPPRR